MAGGVLAVVSVLLFAAAWALFDAGQPGAPLFPDTRPDYGFDGRVTIFIPQETKLTGSSLNVSYGQAREPGSRGASTQKLDYSMSTADGQPFTAIVEFRGGARVDGLESGRTEIESIELADRQLALLEFGRGTATGNSLSGKMRIPPTSIENSRTAFVSPTVGAQEQCDGLRAIADDGTLSGLTFAEWERVSGSCTSTRFPRTVYVVLINSDNVPVRVDYLDVEPMESANSKGFQWKAEGDVPTLRVRSSYVDINGEAFAERLLFLSGVVVGLAATSTPFAVQSLYAFAIRRWRSAERPRSRRLRIRRTPRRPPAD